jgi:hypothetical protein
VNKKTQQYKILDKNGYEMPHYTGEFKPYDDYDRAKRLLDRLNKNREHTPYTLIEI